MSPTHNSGCQLVCVPDMMTMFKHLGNQHDYHKHNTLDRVKEVHVYHRFSKANIHIVQIHDNLQVGLLLLTCCLLLNPLWDSVFFYVLLYVSLCPF